MREYGQVQSAFWQSTEVQSWSDTGKLLALYLLTGPHSNGIGCYRLPDGYISADLGWSSERVSKGFAELSKEGFADRFDGVVFLRNFLRWNKVSNGNVAKARFTEFEGLPKGQAKSAVARAMLEFGAHWTDEHRNHFERVSKGYGKQNPTPPNPTQPGKEAKAKAPASPSDRRADLFARWKALPDGGGGAFLAKMLKQHKPESRVLDAVEAVLDASPAEPKSLLVAKLDRKAADEAEVDREMARAV